MLYCRGFELRLVNTEPKSSVRFGYKSYRCFSLQYGEFDDASLSLHVYFPLFNFRCPWAGSICDWLERLGVRFEDDPQLPGFGLAKMVGPHVFTLPEHVIAGIFFIHRNFKFDCIIPRLFHLWSCNAIGQQNVCWWIDVLWVNSMLPQLSVLMLVPKWGRASSHMRNGIPKGSQGMGMLW